LLADAWPLHAMPLRCADFPPAGARLGRSCA
jgi:hypothetical protein